MHAEEHLLRDVLGFRPTAEHPERDAEYPMLVDPHQVLERPRVARAQPPDEIRVVTRRLSHG